jgi:beta-glucosidase
MTPRVRRLRLHLAALLVSCLCTGVGWRASAQPPTAPYKDPQRPVAERVGDLVSRMTLEEKFWQLFMLPGNLDDPAHDYSHGVFGLQVGVDPQAGGLRHGRPDARPAATPSAPVVARSHAERINAIQRYFVEQTRLGIPIIPFDEALHGLTREGATAFPQAIGLAATWDPSLVSRVAAAVARETRTRGIRQVLSPVVNIADDVRWGRVEETYGEDPYLSSTLARAYVEAFERAGIVTTAKHFVANVGEGGRDSYPIFHNERLLAERYFPPFEAAVRQARARSVMTAYNSVDGTPATQSRWLLTDILKGRWGFEGFAISDASATGGATVLHMTEPDTPTAAAHAWASGLDVVFQSSYGEQRPYLEALQRGLVPAAVIDRAVSRVLRAKFELGLFEHPYVDPEAAAAAAGHADHRVLAREAARSSIVLLRNRGGRLPLAAAVRSIAVIGTDATEARLGGYSGPGIAKVPIFDGIRQRAGSRVDVRHVPGPGRTTRDVVRIPADSLTSVAGGSRAPGLTGEYFDNIRLEGQPRLVRTDRQVDFSWTLNPPGVGIPLDWYSVRWTGSLRVPPDGVRRIGLQADDGYRLYLDGRLVVDNWRKQSHGTTLADVSLAPGSSHDVRLEYFETTGNARVRLVWDAGIADDARAKIDEAVALARRSDVAVVVGGIEEGEFRDRAFLGLPGHQETLIQEVAATGTPVVVVLVGGSAITMSRWIDRVDAVIDAWYPGEEGGRGVADVLFGDCNPAGRLPITFPMAEGQLPLGYNHKPTGRGDDYLDLTGQPLFPFGFGLSYTSFEYSALRIEPGAIAPSGTATVRCRVKNTGDREGDEVVQLYVRDLVASLARPVMELKGFRRLRLRPGEEAEVGFDLGPTDLRMLDDTLQWTVEPGTFRVMVGSSSRDIRLRGELRVR